MSDAFDQQITESLHQIAEHTPHRGAGFGDVHRRVRRRRQRHMVAVAAPTMLGTAVLGITAASRNSDGQRPAAGADDASPLSSQTTTTAPVSTTPPTEDAAGTDATLATTTTVTAAPFTLPGTTPPIAIDTTSVGSIVLPDDTNVIGKFVCVDASGGSPDTTRECQAQLGGGKYFAAGALTDHSFVMALDPAYQADAEYAANLLGLPIEPLQDPVLAGIDLRHSKASVVVVIGLELPPCTIPNLPEASADC